MTDLPPLECEGWPGVCSAAPKGNPARMTYQWQDWRGGFIRYVNLCWKCAGAFRRDAQHGTIRILDNVPVRP